MTGGVNEEVAPQANGRSSDRKRLLYKGWELALSPALHCLTASKHTFMSLRPGNVTPSCQARDWKFTRSNLPGKLINEIQKSC